MTDPVEDHAHAKRCFRGRIILFGSRPVFALRAPTRQPSPSSGSPSRSWRQPAKAGGARRDRTDDLMLAKHALSQLSYGPVTRRRMLGRLAVTVSPSLLYRASPGTLRSALRGCATHSRRRSVVGLGRLELPTSRLSSARSNQLSYKPLTRGAFMACAHPASSAGSNRTSAAPGACSSAKKEKRRRRNPANGAHQILRSMAPECF